MAEEKLGMETLVPWLSQQNSPGCDVTNQLTSCALLWQHCTGQSQQILGYFHFDIVCTDPCIKKIKTQNDTKKKKKKKKKKTG